MEQPEAQVFLDMMKDFDKEQANLLATITGTSAIEPFILEITGRSPEQILDDVIKHLEREFYLSQI